MAVITKYVEFSTAGEAEARDITAEISRALNETEMMSGTVTVFVPGATGGITTVEFEPGLEQDMKELWERIAPSDVEYNHDRAWGDGNGHAHLRATLLGPSLTIPFVDGELTLGTWQQVIMVDFDNKPRQRRIVLQFIGE